MKILDCHLSYGATVNGKPYRCCGTFEELRGELSRSGIDGGLVRCVYSSSVGVNYGNGFLAKDLAESGNKDLWGVWAALPPFTDETPPPRLLPAAMKQNRIAAIYLDPRVHRYELNRLTVGELLDTAERRRIPVLLNTALGVPMEKIYAILRDFPKLTVLLGDSDCWPNARRLYPLAATYENVYLDLSYVMDAGGVEDMTRRFGAQRLLFGTAFPERYTGSMLAVVRGAAIGEKERAAIFGGNLERLIGEEDLSE